jgi:hypothetical protein
MDGWQQHGLYTNRNNKSTRTTTSSPAAALDSANRWAWAAVAIRIPATADNQGRRDTAP